MPRGDRISTSTPSWRATQRERFQAFLIRLIVAAAIFVFLEALAFIYSGDTSFGIASLTSFGCLCGFLIALTQLRRQRMQRAVIILHTAFLATTLIGAMVWPNVLPMLVILPLLAFVSVLPYIDRRTLPGLGAACWVVIIVIAVMGEMLPARSTAPPWLISIFRVSSLATATALLLFLLKHFSNWLVEMLANTERAERRQRLLSETSKSLASTLDYHATLNNLTKLVVPALADWCFVDVVQPDRSIQRVALAARNPNAERLLREIQQRYPPTWESPQPASQALRAGAPLLLGTFTHESLAATARDGEHMRLLQALAPRSAMVVPLVARGHTLGVITLAISDPDLRYNEDDLVLAEEFAYRAALALDNARLYAEAQEAIHLRDQFLSVASHELKTPLTSLLGYTELLTRRAARETALSERSMRAITMISAQSIRLSKLISALLDISRIQTGQLSIEQATLDLAALIGRVVEEIQTTLDQHAIIFQKPEGQVLIKGDELRLEQVLQNLIGNAVKYSPAGGTITIRLEQRVEMVHVEVEDHGLGIPPAALPHLFQRFYRAPNVNYQRISGLGIGLYVVKQIVGLHGGTISVASIEGRGSTFTIELPMAHSADQRQIGTQQMKTVE